MSSQRSLSAEVVPGNNVVVKPLHIGIAACSAEGAALCYRTICTEAPALMAPHAHPEISMHTPSLADYMALIYRGGMRCPRRRREGCRSNNQRIN